MTSRRNHHLEQRGQRWYYVRRVPARFKSIDKRRIVRTTLCTDSLTIARERRDMMMDTDEQNWELALAKQLNITTADSPEMCRYRLARRKAQAVGFEFKPVLEIAHNEPRETILRRVQTLREDSITQLETEAILGIIEPPKDTIRAAFNLYCDKLSISDQSGKSLEQIESWKRAKVRAVDNFVALCGNLTMDAITRQQGREFYDWWAERLRPDNSQGHTYRPNSANRELGNLRLLFREYWTYHGDETRENPFRKLRFKNTPTEPTAIFSDDWVRSKILKPYAFEGINAEAQIIAYTLIETGCRPSEIANLLPENICLDADVPHIRIRPTADRQNEYTALWLPVPHVYQFNRSINPNKYYWCGQAAITTVMEYSGIIPKYDSTTGLKAIHEWLRKNKTSTYNETYFARKDIKEICPQKYCADIDELRAAARDLGMGSSIKKSVQLNNEAVFQQIIGGIEQKRPMIVSSWYDLQNESGAGHFWIIAGIVNKGNAGNSVVLLEDVAASQGNKRWDKKVLVKDFVSGLESYRKKNGWSTTSFNMLILK